MTQSLFPSTTVREGLANGNRQLEWDKEEEEEDEFKVQRSATSPPLLDSFTRSAVRDGQRLSYDLPVEGEERRSWREIKIEAEVHELEPISGSSQETASRPQLLSLEPSPGGGREGEVEVEVEIEVAGEKTFSLKFSDV